MAVKAALNCLRVLCIQSHVVHGYVGNKIAVFPLQVLGIEVDYINSVQFSNHTGYEIVKGQVLDAASMKDLYLGLKANGLSKYTHVLTGYLASPSSLEAVADIVSDLKKENSNIKYYCDPVLGDNGKLYVPPELVQIYQEKILPLSDVILPNQFEAEILSGIQITDEKSALNCIHHLHKQYHIPTVIITSTNSVCSSSSMMLYGYASRLINHQMKNDHGADNMIKQTNGSIFNNNSNYERVRFKIPHFNYHFIGTGDHLRSLTIDYERVRFKIPHFNYHFIGTGDLFAALTLAHLEAKIDQENNQPIAKYSFKDAFQSILSTMQAVLSRTIQLSEKESTSMPKAARIELKIIQSLDAILNPPLGDDYVEKM